MKINFIEDRPTKAFHELLPAEVFWGDRGYSALFMKLQTAPTVVTDGQMRNAVSLSDGKLWTFSSGTTVVIPTECDLTLK